MAVRVRLRLRGPAGADLATSAVIELLHAAERVTGCAVTFDREGRSVEFRAFVSEGDSEVLVSDGGIDALGIRIESFVPGRWRFADETHIRETEAPQYW